MSVSLAFATFQLLSTALKPALGLDGGRNCSSLPLANHLLELAELHARVSIWIRPDKDEPGPASALLTVLSRAASRHPLSDVALSGRDLATLSPAMTSSKFNYAPSQGAPAPAIARPGPGSSSTSWPFGRARHGRPASGRRMSSGPSASPPLGCRGRTMGAKTIKKSTGARGWCWRLVQEPACCSQDDPPFPFRPACSFRRVVKSRERASEREPAASKSRGPLWPPPPAILASSC